MIETCECGEVSIHREEYNDQGISKFWEFCDHCNEYKCWICCSEKWCVSCIKKTEVVENNK